MKSTRLLHNLLFICSFLTNSVFGMDIVTKTIKRYQGNLDKALVYCASEAESLYNVLDIRALLRAGANPNTHVWSSDDTPLALAIFFSGHTTICKATCEELLANGSLVERKVPFGRDPLTLAVCNERDHITRLLLDYGANIAHTGDLLKRATMFGLHAQIRLLMTHPQIDLHLPRADTSSTQTIQTALLCFRKLCPRMPWHVRKQILCAAEPLASDYKYYPIKRRHAFGAQRVQTALLCFRRVCPQIPRDIRWLICSWLPDDSLCYPFKQSVDALAAKKKNELLPLLPYEKFNLNHGMMTLINPELFEENFGRELRLNIRDALRSLLDRLR